MSELFDPDAEMDESAFLPRAVFDDGKCARTKISVCPVTFKEFVNRCTKDAFHKSGCSFVTRRQDVPQQQSLFRR
jgi:hypothetical protein